ncbi:MAG: SUMF1/EgtB/PvdO family nonheme iron enzyme [Polyangiaceae bacterium]
MRSFFSALLPLLLVSAVSSDASATDPLEKWWVGLDAAASSPNARGVLLLRTPSESRVRLPGGIFIMGSTPAELDEALDLCRRDIDGTDAVCEKIVTTLLYETSAHQVTLDPFAIDRTEVSVAAYRKCVAKGACLRAQLPIGDPHFDRPNLPVTFVSWDDARAYCGFVGGRLPTEAEWEFAARGETRRIFPWGNLYNPHLANHGTLAQATDATDGYELIAPVDAFPDGATPDGVLQLAGNVSEWVFDFFSPDITSYGYPPAAVVNPKGAPNGVVHVVRGGSYEHGALNLRAAARLVDWTYAADVGFRCAYD